MSPLTPPSRLVLATAPVAFRQGIDGLGAVCRPRRGDPPLEGAVSVFRNRSGTALKLLLSDGQGLGLLMKRLSQGRCHWWPRTADTRVPGSARALIILLWHGAPARAHMAQDWRRVAEGGVAGATSRPRRACEVQGHPAEGSAHTSARCSCRATRYSRTWPPADIHVTLRLVSTRAISALCSRLSHSEFFRCRMNSFQARATPLCSRDAPGRDKKRVSVCQGFCL
jgi:hypothetical protein